jgi:hypothetical protein
MRGCTVKRRLRKGCNIGIIRPEASGICIIPGTSEVGHELAENPTDWLLRLVILHPHPRLAVDVVSILDDRNEHAVDDRADDRAVGASRTLSGVPVGSVTLQRSPPAADARVALSRNASAAIETLVNPSSLKKHRASARQIEDPSRLEFPLAHLSDGNKRAARRGVDSAGENWRIPAAQQYRLPATEPSRIGGT